MPYRNEDFDRLQPGEFPEPDDDGDDDVDVCPNCRAMIQADSPRCPVCGEYVSAGSGPMPWWMYVGVLACLAMALAWAVWG